VKETTLRNRPEAEINSGDVNSEISCFISADQLNRRIPTFTTTASHADQFVRWAQVVFGPT